MMNKPNPVSTYPSAAPTAAMPAATMPPANVLPLAAYPNVPPVYAAQWGPPYKPPYSGMMMGQGQMMPPPGVGMGPAPTMGQQAFEESYVENILRLNLGKMVTLYMTYENNSQWNAKIFKGRIEAAGRDHIIISDPQTGMRYLLLMVNLDYATFDEPLNYSYPMTGTVPPGAGR